MTDMLTMPALRERGWTPAMVRDLLGDPDELRPNPVYRSAAPMRLWALERVTAAEDDPAFGQRQAASRKRAAAAAETAERKRQELLTRCRQLPVQVPVLDRNRLISQACRHYNSLQMLRDEHYATAGPDSDPQFLERITVNYLRHELTDYEYQLAELFGQIGRAEATAVIRERIYGAISEAYPDLAAECDRQLSERLGAMTSAVPSRAAIT